MIILKNQNLVFQHLCGTSYFCILSNYKSIFLLPSSVRKINVNYNWWICQIQVKTKSLSAFIWICFCVKYFYINFNFAIRLWLNLHVNYWTYDLKSSKCIFHIFDLSINSTWRHNCLSYAIWIHSYYKS